MSIIATNLSIPVLAGGIAVAAVAWAFMFALDRQNFWPRAAVAALAVSAYAVAAEPHAMGHLFTRPRWELDLLLGVGSGLVLYVVFWIGEQLLVVVAPTLADEVTDLYAVRGQTAAHWIPLVLALAAPGEELMFRGFLQYRAGWAVALTVYGLVHVWERKPILILAAVVAGAYWGALLTITGGLVAPIASHLCWALLIIWWRPARPTGRARRLRARLVSARPGT